MPLVISEDYTDIPLTSKGIAFTQLKCYRSEPCPATR